MNIKKALGNNQHWLKNRLSVDNQYFKNLSKGQSPEILYIGCSDSRVPIEAIIEANPGDVFVQRNIANLVPVNDLSTISVIEYAVTHLKVKHLVVCGHSGCGGVKAAIDSTDLGVLNPWIRNIKDVYNKHIGTIEKIENEDERVNKLIELNVIEQCTNTLKLSCVKNAVNNNSIKVHAWIYDLPNGSIIDLGFDDKKNLLKLKG